MALGFRFDAIRRALGIRNYRIYTSGNIVAHFGVWAYRIGLLSLTWELTESAFWLGAMAMADLFPTVVLSPLAGALTERINRMAMMRFTVIFTGLQSSVLALLCVNGTASIAIVFPLALVLGIVLAINHPMRLVIVTNLVGRDAVPSALAINSLVFNVARVAGPSIAGGIIAATGDGTNVLGTAIVFGFCAVGHLIFAIALFMVLQGSGVSSVSFAGMYVADSFTAFAKAMVLIAATFTLRHARQGGGSYVIGGGVLTGFVLYFFSDIVFALGLSDSIPATLAAWTPAGVATLLGLATLLHLEDG